MKIKKQPLILLVILALTAFQVLGATIPDNTYTRINPTTATTGNVTDLSSLILADGVKTRYEITNYMDRKYDQQMGAFRSDFKAYVDDNFNRIDAKVHFLVLKAQIQMIIAIGTTIILASAIWYFIRRKILKKEEKKPRYILLDEFTAQKFGIATEDYLNNLQKKNEAPIIAKEQTEGIKSPPPPTMQEIENKFLNRFNFKKNKEQEKKEKEEKAKMQEAERQALEAIKKQEELRKAEELLRQETLRKEEEERKKAEEERQRLEAIRKEKEEELKKIKEKEAQLKAEIDGLYPESPTLNEEIQAPPPFPRQAKKKKTKKRAD